MYICLDKIINLYYLSIMSEQNSETRTYETPRVLTQAELILLEILKSQLKIEEAKLKVVMEPVNYNRTMEFSITAACEEIERQIDELTRPITKTFHNPY